MSTKPYLLWKFIVLLHYITYFSVCVWVRMCACDFMRVGVNARSRACGFVRVALFSQHATRIRHIVCGLSGFTTFFDIISQTTQFSGKKKLLSIKRVFWFYLKHFSRLHVKNSLFLSEFNETRVWIEFWKKLKYQISSKSVQWEPSFSMRTKVVSVYSQNK